MRGGLPWPHRRLSGSPLWLLQSLHLCRPSSAKAANWTGQQRCSAVHCLWQTVRLYPASHGQLCGCCLQLKVCPCKGSRVCWMWVTQTSPAPQCITQHQLLWAQGYGLPLTCKPVRLKQFFIGKWWKMTPQKLDKTKMPLFLFKRLLQDEKMVVHENRPVTDSHMLLNVYVYKIQGWYLQD